MKLKNVENVNYDVVKLKNVENVMGDDAMKLNNVKMEVGDDVMQVGKVENSVVLVIPNIGTKKAVVMVDNLKKLGVYDL